MDVEQLEGEAKATAAKHVINMLQRPGQLEKVGFHALTLYLLTWRIW
jgi:hypothetical protein